MKASVVSFEPQGLSDHECSLHNLSDGNEMIFAHVRTIEFVELDQTMQPGNREVKTDVADGQVITFKSILSNPNLVDATSLPSALIVTIDGYSASGQTLRGTWSLKFSNSCTVFPVVQGGEQTILAVVVSSIEVMKGEATPSRVILSDSLFLFLF